MQRLCIIGREKGCGGCKRIQVLNNQQVDLTPHTTVATDIRWLRLKKLRRREIIVGKGVMQRRCQCFSLINMIMRLLIGRRSETK